MKKIFTLLVAMLMATSMMAQMPSAMKFVGASNVKVLTSSNDTPHDTVSFAMATGSITFPEMQGMSTIPSFTISGVKYTMGANHVVTFDEQTFSTTVTVDGKEKKVTGSSLTGSYNMADNSFQLTVVFNYGAMPFPATYTIKGYYVKPVTKSITVAVAGQNYSNESVTYQVRKYMDGDVEKVDVEVPTYSLTGTLMGDLTLGTYTVKGLTYDETKGGFYRDYKNDGLTFHFKAVQGGTATMDKDYEFNAAKENNIFVKYDGTTPAYIVNNFQMGAMPFAIVSTFGQNVTNGIDAVKANAAKVADGKMYNLAGQLVGEDYKGIVIINGKKYLKK